MAVSHLHSVKVEKGYHHLFSLSFMSAAEVQVLYMALNSKPIPIDKVEILNNIRAKVQSMIDNSVVKDKYASEEAKEHTKPEVVEEDTKQDN